MHSSSEAGETHPTARPPGILRRAVYPLLVIAAIAGAIWWLDYRGDDGTSPSGERYGPVEMPAGLLPAGAQVEAKEGALAPDFLLEDLAGGELRLSGFRGHPVVLNFWATWCEPCRKEMPQFVRAYDELRDQGLVVLAVNLQEGKSIAQPFVEDFGMKFPVAIDRDGEVGDRFRLLGLPTTFFIDRNGVIRSTFTGPFVEEKQGTNVQGAIAQSELGQRIAEIMAIPQASPAAESSGGGR